MDAAAVAELFAPVLAVRTRRMFGGLGVYSGEAMFALAYDGEIFLKTTEATPAGIHGGRQRAVPLCRT
jgi:DNA transformation protein